ncbi:putative ABC transport system permease protein [Sporosarcina luteola]|nr:putative ABC transport system permease protein [Sporosarcina luteola]
MYSRMIRNDMSKSRLITLATTLFIAAAAMLVSLAAVLVIHLSGAIDTLMKRSETPHFMQMHRGDIDLARLEEFAEQHDNVQEFQVLKFLNIDGSQIRFGNHSLVNHVQDNGFSVQSEKFDYLLDLNGNIIQVNDGELYVPISYWKDGITKVGDEAVISGKLFTVAGFLRDSQMNSSLASSKRFLISPNDFEDLQNRGSIEYLIEFRLVDFSQLKEFETAYALADLETNGPTLTYPLFKTINAISDGMMIGVIILVSLLVVAIAFMCIRFTLLTKIEEDYREIGVMKAIGLRVSDIKRMYLGKYAFIAAMGSILGFLLSFLFQGVLLANIRLYMGESENASLGWLFGVLGSLFVFTAILVYVNGVLKRFHKISAAEAIRFGMSQDKTQRTKGFRLRDKKLLTANIYLGIKDVLTRKRLYGTMLAVLVISTFMMIVPQNLYNTISSDDFIKYMGIGKSDLRIDVQQTENIVGKSSEIRNMMQNDNTISKYAMFTTKTFKMRLKDGTEETIKIEIGDHSQFPVEYSEGRAPIAEDEIALSVLNAEELARKVGDTVPVVIHGMEQDLTVSGIYSDITNGGKTAKAVFDDNTAESMWVVFAAKLADPILIESKVSEYASKFSYAKVSNINQYILQTFGSTMNSVGKATYSAIAVALILSVVITLLFMKMLIAKDRYSISVLKAIGFTNSDIQTQYISRSVFILVIGIFVGTILANTLGEMIAGGLISSFGASTFQFTINPITAYLFSPLLLISFVLIATVVGALGAGRLTISGNIKG